MPAYKAHRHQDNMTATADKYPQKYFKVKPCKRCSTSFQPNAPSHLYCSQDCMEDALTNAYLLKNYQITLEKFREMFEEQKGVCKLCKSPGFALVKGQRILLVVDHCHVSGNVRGLLCHNCNRALGLFKDSIETLKNAVDYLEGVTTIETTPEGGRE